MDNNRPLPDITMKKAVKGICYISHPLRLRIVEYIDVNGASCVSAVTKALNEEQAIISQNLRKLREAGLLKTKRCGIFIYYDICEEYPASIFVCIRKLFGYLTDSFRFLAEGYKAVLPHDFTTMVANRIKLFAHYEKMRILEHLILNGESSVSDIASASECPPIKTSQLLKKLKDDGFVTCRREGRFIRYSITKGVHKTALECIRKRYNSLKNKENF